MLATQPLIYQSNLGNVRVSFVISDSHNGHDGSLAKLNESLIQPLHSSFVHAHTTVSTSGKGSRRPRENPTSPSPFNCYKQN